MVRCFFQKDQVEVAESATQEAGTGSAPDRCDCDSQPRKTDVDMPGMVEPSRSAQERLI